METPLNILLLAGAVSWITTAIVSKAGPFNVFAVFRLFFYRLLRGKTPFDCFHCASFWIGLATISLFVSGDIYVQALIQFFGVLGIAQALRGMSGEWK